MAEWTTAVGGSRLSAVPSPEVRAVVERWARAKAMAEVRPPEFSQFQILATELEPLVEAVPDGNPRKSVAARDLKWLQGRVGEIANWKGGDKILAGTHDGTIISVTRAGRLVDLADGVSARAGLAERALQDGVDIFFSFRSRLMPLHGESISIIGGGVFALAVVVAGVVLVRSCLDKTSATATHPPKN